MPVAKSRTVLRVPAQPRSRADQFDPRSIPGLLADYDSTVGVYKDAGQTPATNSSAVASWYDQSGNGNHITQGTGAAQPTFQANQVNGLPSVLFAASKTLAGPSFLPASGEYTVAAVGNTTSSNLGSISSGTGMRCFYGTNNSLMTLYHNANFAVAAQAYTQTTYHSWIGAYSSRRSRGGVILYDGGLIGAGQAANDNTDYTFQIGSAGAGGRFAGSLARQLVWNRRLSDAEMQAVAEYFRARYNLSRVTPSPIIIFDGNSLTYGTNASSGQGTVTGTVYPAVVMSSLLSSYPSHPYIGLNIGVQGQTLTTMIGRSLASVSPFSGGRRPKSIVTCWEITNEVSSASYGPGTARQTLCYANVVNYCLARRAEGHKVIVYTCLPTASDAQVETDRTAVNSLIRSNWSTFADALCDVGADATIGAAGSQNNTTYYNADKIHLTDAGYAIVAGLAVTAITSIW